MNLVSCDKCAKQTSLENPIYVVGPHMLPVGWARVNILLTEELAPAAPYPGVPYRKLAAARPMPEIAPPLQLPQVVGVPTVLDLCPDCAEGFFQASGCSEKIRREP